MPPPFIDLSSQVTTDEENYGSDPAEEAFEMESQLRELSDALYDKDRNEGEPEDEPGSGKQPNVEDEDEDELGDDYVFEETDCQEGCSEELENESNQRSEEDLDESGNDELGNRYAKEATSLTQPGASSGSQDNAQETYQPLLRFGVPVCYVYRTQDAEMFKAWFMRRPWFQERATLNDDTNEALFQRIFVFNQTSQHWQGWLHGATLETGRYREAQAATGSTHPLYAAGILSEDDRLMVEMWASLYLSFNSVENPHFINWVRHICPTYDLPRSRALKDRCEKYAEEVVRLELQDIPPESHVSVTTDVWTSPGLAWAFQGVYVHFVDKNWTLKHVLIDIQLCEDKKGKSNTQALYEALKKYGLHTRVQAGLEVEKDEKGIAKIKQIKLDTADRVVAGVRWLATYLNLSTERQQRFRRIQTALKERGILNIQRPLQAIRDVKTRWSSVVYMLVRARRLRPAIEDYIRREKMTGFEMTETTWDIIDYLIDICKPFLLLTTLFGASKETNYSHVLAGFKTIKKHLRKCEIHLQDRISAGAPQPYLKGLLQAVQDCSEFHQRYIDKAFKNNKYHLILAMLLYPLSDSRTELHFDGWKTFLGQSSTDDFSRDEAIRYFKSAYKSYYEKYGDDVAKLSRRQRTNRSLSEIMTDSIRTPQKRTSSSLSIPGNGRPWEQIVDHYLEMHARVASQAKGVGGKYPPQGQGKGKAKGKGKATPKAKNTPLETTGKIRKPRRWKPGNFRFQRSAIDALQEATEAAFTTLFTAANLCCIHSKRVTLMTKDMKLVYHITGMMLPVGPMGLPEHGISGQRLHETAEERQAREIRRQEARDREQQERLEKARAEQDKIYHAQQKERAIRRQQLKQQEQTMEKFPDRQYREPRADTSSSSGLSEPEEKGD
ncbi:hypothetical protein DL768_011158 [Monosporascus sp. mg162]|nr:hypothetical protein DL768_011158 [Monosporascus sp. mg162]